MSGPPRCQSCRQPLPGAVVDPFTEVVTGRATEGEAPTLWGAWRAVSALLTASDGRWLPRHEVTRAAALLNGAVSAKTAEHLLRAAGRAGVVDEDRRTTGTPQRSRVWVRWPGGV